MNVFLGMVFIFIPITVTIFLHQRYNISLTLLSVGIAAFALAFILQVLLLLPLGNALASPLVGGMALGIIVGFTDGLARFCGYQFLAKHTLYRPQAVMIGIGYAVLPLVVHAYNLMITHAEIGATILNLAPFIMSLGLSWLILQTFLRNEAKWLFWGILYVAIAFGTREFLLLASERTTFATIWMMMMALGGVMMLFMIHPPHGYEWTN